MGSVEDVLAPARARLENSHSIARSQDSPRNPIRDSWQRCLDAGLDPVQIPRTADASSQDLKDLIDQESFLLHLARSEFRKLQGQLTGDNCLLGFANRDAVLIDVVCSNPGVRVASRALPGSCWRESFRGTNAIGTAAFTRRPIAVVMREHFLRDYCSLICIAATISDSDGNLVGVLHVSANSPIREQRTMSLLCMSTLQMESELFKERYRSQIVLQFHSRDEYADTFDAGLIAIDEDGRILSSNRQARLYLEGLPLEAGRHFDEIFRVPFRQLITGSRMGNDPTQLIDIKGGRSAARIHVRVGGKSRPTPKRFSAASLPDTQSAKFIFSDPAVSHGVSVAERAVAMSIPILIRGETGTGKDVLAHHAHRRSGRRGRFIAVNCAAVPESLIESELFGYREGSFTGARSGGSEGLILQADSGTLFLDEIGDMPINLQPALLRFLDSWTVRPIGSKEEVTVDVQLITATNCDLEHAICERRFRRDLLHRINGVEILLPPLRMRSDFDEVVRELLARISPHLDITVDALRLLRDQPWDGNLRELSNTLIRSTLNCTDTHLSSRELEPYLRRRPRPVVDVQNQTSALAELRRKAILDAYEMNRGNISKTAKSLSISRNTLYRELRHAGVIDADSGDRPFSRRDARFDSYRLIHQ